MAGRARDTSIDERALAAARHLVAEQGDEAVTLGAVARLAGVSRPAVYRRWANRAALLFELQTSATVPPMPDLGDLAVELRAAARHLVTVLETADRSIAADQYALMITDAAFAQRVWERRWEPDRQKVLTLWERAVARGDVRPDADGGQVIDTLVAACVFRVVLLHQPCTDAWLGGLVDMLLHGAAAG